MHQPVSPSSRGSSSMAVDGLWFAGVALLSFAIRWVYLHQIQAYPLFSEHQMDPLFHHQWAVAWAQGQRFWDGAYFRAPLYPWFLGLIYKLFGVDPMTPRIVQAIIGSLTCGLVFVLGRIAFSRVVGVVAGVTAATYWLLIYYESELLIEVLCHFFNTVLLILLLLAARRDRYWLWLLAGLAMGLSAIARPNILLFAPALVGWLVVCAACDARRDWKQATLASACLFFGCITPILPITIRNVVVGGDFSLIATQGGVNLYIGNNPGSDGMSAVIPGDPPEWWPCYRAQVQRAEQALGRPLKGSEVSRYYARLTREFYMEQPLAALTLLAKKLLYFWSHWEISNNQDIYYVTREYAPLMRALPIGFWLIGPLGLLGLALCFRRPLELFPLWGFVLIYMLGVVAFFVTARYRLPVVVTLIPMASWAAVWLVERARVRAWKALAGAALLLGASGVLAAQTPPGVDRAHIQARRTLGLLYADHGDIEQAEALLSAAMRDAEGTVFENDPLSWLALGAARYQKNDLPGARQAFERVLRRDPQNTAAKNNLAAILGATGDVEGATRLFEEVVASAPGDGDARVNLGLALLRRDRLDEAREHIARAVQINADNARAFASVAQQLVQQGRPADATAVLEAARAAAPDHLDLLIPLTQLYASAGEVELAVTLADRLLALTQRQDATALLAASSAYFAANRREDGIAALRHGLEIARQGNREALERQIQQRLAQQGVSP